MFGAELDLQWGRYAKVVFQNFTTGLNTTIDNLKIQVKYKCTIDESTDTSNGEIKIYGLTSETFEKLGERNQCEIEVHAGYLHSKTNTPRLLFKAVLVDKSFEVAEGTTVSTFAVLNNLLSRKSGVGGRKVSISFAPRTKIMDILTKVSETLGFEDFGVRMLDRPNSGMIFDFLEKYRVPYGYSLYGTPEAVIKKLCRDYGFSYTTTPDSRTMSLYLRDEWFDYYGGLAEQAFNPDKSNLVKAAENKKPEPISEPEPKSTGKSIIPTFDSLNKSQALFFSNDTGLIGTPKFKTIVTDVAYDQGLRKTEEIKTRKVATARKNKKGEVIIDKKTNEVSMTKTPKEMKIFRRQAEAKIYINASVVPQIHVQLSTNSGVADGIYKVRSLEISLDTEGDEWFMDLVLNE